MSKELDTLIEKIHAVEDSAEREDLIQQAFEMDHHDPRVLNLAAESTEDPYERLRLLDHALRHARHDLMHAGLFEQDKVGALGQYEEGLPYLEMMANRLATLLELQYDYQALADANELLYLDQEDTLQVRYAALQVCLRTHNFPLAEAVYRQYKTDSEFALDFPYAALLFAENRTEEAGVILKELLENTPHFKTVLHHVSINKDLDEAILNDAAEILHVLAKVGPYLPAGLIESIDFSLYN